ncbi:MAG TPA: hypothetical protein VF676_06480 [Flavobacterium sp.]|jgi:large-conductance mechanosensitive channel
MVLKTIYYKRVIIGITAAFIGLIIFLTAKIIGETENWSYWAVDFHGHSDEISAYGSLIGGILSFLSILFVLYNIFEVRGQLEKQHQDRLNEEQQGRLNKLKLISNILIATTDEITSQGEKMKEFFDAEKAAPSEMHILQWNTNRHFGRLMNMDFEDMFKSFQTFFNDDPNWNKTLLNLYNLNDFYGDAFAELKQKYREQIHWKVAEQKRIGNDMNELLTITTDLVEIYREQYGVEEYLNFRWSALMNKYVPDHYGYLERVSAAGEMPDFRHISDNLLLPLLHNSMAVRAIEGFDKNGSKEVVKLGSTIRKKINEVELYCVQYADDIEKNYTNYFSPDNESLILYKGIKEKIDVVITKHS